MRKMQSVEEMSTHEQNPFVLEVTGRMGASASEFLRTIMQEASSVSTVASTNVAKRTFENGLSVTW